MILESTTLVDYFTIAGLVCDLFGVGLVFWFAPDKPHPQFGVTFKVQDHCVKKWESERLIRQCWTRAGLLAIFIGFTIQAV